MGLCRDFGSHISQGCDHPMRADSDSCHCEQCGVVCRGKFEACPSVWAQGPQPVVFAPAQSAEAVVFAPAPSTDATWIPPATNGHARQEAAAPQPSANGTEAEAHTVTAAPLTSGGAGDEIGRAHV